MEIKQNPYIRKSLYILTLIMLVVVFGILYRNQQHQICETIEIDIEAPLEKQLVTIPLVQNKLEEWYDGGLSGVKKKNLAVNEIESKLEEIPAIENAEVSFDLRGVLNIAIKQRLPIIRILPSAGQSYYLSLDGTKIPISKTEVARVPIATGNLSASMIKKVYTLSTYVQENEFIEALTEQIFVNNNNDLVIVPKIKSQRIIIGDTTDVETKFNKLQDFYTHGLSFIGWNKYKTINLKYKNQIVCK